MILILKKEGTDFVIRAQGKATITKFGEEMPLELDHTQFPIHQMGKPPKMVYVPNYLASLVTKNGAIDRGMVKSSGKAQAIMWGGRT